MGSEMCIRDRLGVFGGCTIGENVKHAQANGHVKGPGRYGRHVQRDSRDNLKKPYFVFMRNPETGLSFSGGYFVSVAEAQGRADAIIVINEWDREPHFMPLNRNPRPSSASTPTHARANRAEATCIC